MTRPKPAPTVCSRYRFAEMVCRAYGIPTSAIMGKSLLHNGRKPTARRKARK